MLPFVVVVVSGVRQDLREGMAALTYSISAVHDNQLKGTETVLVRFEGNISAATSSSITSEVGL